MLILYSKIYFVKKNRVNTSSNLKTLEALLKTPVSQHDH